MDLRGSLVDTNLKLYPSQKLLNFLKSMPLVDDTPENIEKIVKDGKPLEKKEKKKSIEDECLQASIQFTNKDIENLNKIKEKVIKLGHKGFLNPDQKTADETEGKQEKEKQKTVDAMDGKQKTKQKKIADATKDKQKEKQQETEDETMKPSEKEDEEESPIEREGPYLHTSDIDWLHAHLQKRRKHDKDVPYLHELFEGTDIELPINKIIKRNPVLEARCVKLRAQQEARQYRKMTRSVDNVRIRYPDDSISYALKQINRQLIAIGQFVISIFAGFLFGFRGVEWMVGNLDFGFRLLLGVMCALVIALAEIYFLAKKLNEELNLVDTVQLGGPPKLADHVKNGYEPASTTTTAAAGDKEKKD